MFAYLAFKALAGHYPDKLKSPARKTPWKFDSTLGLPCLKATKRTFQEGHGVYAATVEEAREYTAGGYHGVYLVAPLPGKQAEERYIPQIAQALAETKDAEHLYYAGRDWPDGRYMDDILQTLIKTGNRKYLCLAQQHWPAGRVSDALAAALRESGNSYWIAQAKASWRTLSFS